MMHTFKCIWALNLICDLNIQCINREIDKLNTFHNRYTDNVNIKKIYAFQHFINSDI